MGTQLYNSRVSEPSARARAADWLGLNRATLAVLAVIGFLGLSEEVWSNFLSLYLKDQTAATTNSANPIADAALLMGAIAAAKNLLEGFGYVIGGTIAHRMGPRVALAVSAVPMAIGFTVMLVSPHPWVIGFGALLMTNWEPLSVPATFDVVGSEVPKNRRTIAFAVQSIQKRVPKMIGPMIGVAAFVAIGYSLNLIIAFGLVGLAVIIQLTLTRHMKAKTDPPKVPMREIMRTMSPDLRRLLSAEIFIRWGDWFARDFAVLYVVWLLTTRFGWGEPDATKVSATLLTIMATTALATYIPMAKWIDRASSPRPFIGVTFFLFAIFPLCLVLLPRFTAGLGLSAVAGLVITFVLNGLRELGEPARKALITTGFAPEIRARGVGIYWGLRSFAFFPAPLVAGVLWRVIGPDATFLIGGTIGLIGTAIFALKKSTSS